MKVKQIDKVVINCISAEFVQHKPLLENGFLKNKRLVSRYDKKVTKKQIAEKPEYGKDSRANRQRA